MESSYCAGSYSYNQVKALPSSLPQVEVLVKGKRAKALVDTGCSTTVVAAHLVDNCSGTCSLVAFDGREVQCKGTSTIEFGVRGVQMRIRVIVASNIVNGIDVVMGMDVIGQLGGVTTNNNKVVPDPNANLTTYLYKWT